MCFEQKEVGHGVVDKQQGLGTPGEEEPRINVNQDVSNGHRAIQVSDGSLVLQSLPQGSVVCWDRFLPIKSLKVLLVKNDDSTRHVVSALLRNCSYEVNAVANGLQAWKILEDSNNHINLVLKEGVMPILSRIGLLCKLMRHKSLKNIPVIMMSSHDSMGIVCKCLSKGVVDFLVKPIRKNGLKNLWQHLWRRCHSVSCYKFLLQTHLRSDMHIHPWEIPIFNRRFYGHAHLVVEVYSPKPMSSGDQLTDAPDSTCAQVIHTKLEKCSSRHYKLPGIDSQPFEGKLDHNGRNINSSAKFKQTFDSLNGVSDISQVKGNRDSGEHPSLELTLKRLRGAGDGKNLFNDGYLKARKTNKKKFIASTSPIHQFLPSHYPTFSTFKNTSRMPQFRAKSRQRFTRSSHSKNKINDKKKRKINNFEK
ncbi:hypothetical protein UlMin_023903 [Ulmus minor]